MVHTYRRHTMPFGAEVLEDGEVRFRLWAPAHAAIDLCLQGEGGTDLQRLPMFPGEEGWHELRTGNASAGSLYRFALPGGALVADPASRFQPADVHGPSEVIDPADYLWNDSEWNGRPWEEAILYELHLGAFTPEGTFCAAIEKLDHLARLGVTAIEIMPVADFPGQRDWGYDGVFLFAPDSTYGRPADMKAFVDAAHAHGIMVLLDVVYNHFGPEGNYLSLYAPAIFTDRHHTPWGAAINYDGPSSLPVREFVVHNALYWLEEFHLDGLRYDAVHAILDDSSKHILKESAERIRAAAGDRFVHLLLENERNQRLYLERDHGGQPQWFTAQWNDDVHHALHTAATEESNGYYERFCGDTEILGRALSEGFASWGDPKYDSTAEETLPRLGMQSFVAYIQNHDQVGNRAFGDRIDCIASPEAARAVRAIYILLPQIPMLFMGEEWHAAEPFPFFCDFSGGLADAVRNGRRAEFAKFPEFQDLETRDRIPDPQAESTFLAAKLNWDDLKQPIHAACIEWYRSILKVRVKTVLPIMRDLMQDVTRNGPASFVAVSRGAVVVRWQVGGGRELVLAANLSRETVKGFPHFPGIPFWIEGEAESKGSFGPWAVRWSIDEMAICSSQDSGALLHEERRA